MIRNDGRVMAETVATLPDGRVTVAVSYVGADVPIYFQDMSIDDFESMVLTRGSE